MTIEKAYFKRYSQQRYNMVHLTHLTPYRKQYNYTNGNYIEYDQLQKDGNYISGIMGSIIEFAVKINRYDILSRYQDHNNSPSARNMHSCEVCFVYSTYVMVYNLYSNSVIEIDQLSKEYSFDKDKLYVFGVSDVLNTSRFYSEFSLYLCLLDAGHLLYNVKLVLNDKDLKANQIFDYDSQLLLKAMKRPEDTVFIPFMIEVDVTQTIKDIEFNKQHNMKVDIVSTKKFNEISDTEYIAELINEFNKSRVQIDKIPINNMYKFISMDKLCKNRHSGHTMVGNFNVSDQFENFNICDAVKIIENSKQVFSCPSIKYAFLRINMENISIYSKDNIIIRDLEDAKFILYNDHQFFDMSTYKYIAVCYAPSELLDSYGIKSLIMSCGELMQLIGLYSASVGYGFRPMKNHNDKQLKMMLDLNENYEITYIGVVCNTSVDQLSFPII